MTTAYSLVNDVHSALNSTRVASVVRPRSIVELQLAVSRAAELREPLSISGGRHAMGGQQFLSEGHLLDLRGLDSGFALDAERGLLRAPGGASWPAIVEATRRGPESCASAWAIRQKQTGADDLTLGGAIACNAHGRGLAMPPLIEDIESLDVVTCTADIVHCSREHNSELFGLVAGGYGLFGVVASATLRLVPRRKLVRHVDIIDLEDAVNAVYRRASEGCEYGDFQYAIDPSDDSFLRRGVFTCYRPAPEGASIRPEGSDLPRNAWLELLSLAHTNKRRAFEIYSQHYLATHGRVYWSDTMQMSTYIPSYAEFVKQAGVGGPMPQTLMISELFVPPDRILEFMRLARLTLRRCAVDDIYGTIRTVQPESTSFMPWAWRDWACIIFNLLVEHSAEGKARVQSAARGLIDDAIAVGGSFYLTYHRWATRLQVLRCYPRFSELLTMKRQIDPHSIVQSDWYRHYLRMFGGMTSKE